MNSRQNTSSFLRKLPIAFVFPWKTGWSRILSFAFFILCLPPPNLPSSWSARVSSTISIRFLLQFLHSDSQLQLTLAVLVMASTGNKNINAKLVGSFSIPFSSKLFSTSLFVLIVFQLFSFYAKFCCQCALFLEISGFDQ